jgi:phosphohistidine phosphatase
MKLLLIRHSLAEEIASSDFERKLTNRGAKRAFRFFEIVKIIYPQIDYIITSEALRAKQTAEILKRFYKNAEFIESAKLYQADVEDFEEILSGIDKGVVAVVGHEPDLSTFVKHRCGDVRIKLSKPSLVEIEDDVLKSLLQYKQAKAVYERLKNDS